MEPPPKPTPGEELDYLGEEEEEEVKPEMVHIFYQFPSQFSIINPQPY